MSSQVTLTLPEDIMRRAEFLAQRTGRPVTEVLTETIELGLRPLGAPANGEKAISTWPDEQVLAAAEATMSPADDQRLTELLDRQQAGLLASGEKAELAALMDMYQDGLLRKAQALHEAVRRGLRGPLQP